jgi:hypothetical protein
MRDKRRKRTREAKRRSERRTIDRLLRAIFTGENLFFLPPAIYTGIDDYKKVPVDIRGDNASPIVRFLIPKKDLASLPSDTPYITAHEAMKFYHKHKAHVVYPLFD